MNHFHSLASTIMKGISPNFTKDGKFDKLFSELALIGIIRIINYIIIKADLWYTHIHLTDTIVRELKRISGVRAYIIRKKISSR